MTADSSVADVYQSLKASLDMFKIAAPENVDVPSKQVLVQAAEQVKNDAAKIGLMCSGGAPPKDQQVSLATALQRSCVTFCIACHALTAAAGPSLKDSLTKLAQNMVNPCLALLKDMGSGKDLKTHVGLVWDRVSAVSKAPVDNKSCLFAALTKVMAVMKDTVREMEELQEEQQEEHGEPDKPEAAAAAPPAAAAAGSNTPAAAAAAAPTSSTSGQQDEQHTEAPSSSKSSQQQQQQQEADGPDLDFEAGEMGYWERQLLTASIQLLQASTAVVKAFGRALLQGPALAAGTDSLDGWESCLWHTKHLTRAVEDLGASMYPPQDSEEVGGAALAVFEVTELMADECPDPEAVGAEQLSTLNQQLLTAHQQVQQLLDQAAPGGQQEQERQEEIDDGEQD